MEDLTYAINELNEIMKLVNDSLLDISGKLDDISDQLTEIQGGIY
ncbi:MAG: hypothetical protein ACI4LK_06860 [Lentihominibacter sp.]